MCAAPPQKYFNQVAVSGQFAHCGGGPVLGETEFGESFSGSRQRLTERLSEVAAHFGMTREDLQERLFG
jgi:hypothetical protein